VQLFGVIDAAPLGSSPAAAGYTGNRQYDRAGQGLVSLMPTLAATRPMRSESDRGSGGVSVSGS
jgi:hypothetical protein